MPVPVADPASRVDESAPARSVALLKNETTVFDDLLAVAEELAAQYKIFMATPAERQGNVFTVHRLMGEAAAAAAQRARPPHPGASRLAELEVAYADARKVAQLIERDRDNLAATVSAVLERSGGKLYTTDQLTGETFDYLLSAALGASRAKKTASPTSNAPPISSPGQGATAAAERGKCLKAAVNEAAPLPPAPKPTEPLSTLRMAHCEMELTGDAEQQRRTINATIDALAQAFLRPHAPPGGSLDIKA